MLGRRRRSLSQRSYMLVQAIHAENDRLAQIDRGLGYRTFATERQDRIGGGQVNAPLHIGPVLDAVRQEDGWAA